jgi:hypothetical protein
MNANASEKKTKKKKKGISLSLGRRHKKRAEKGRVDEEGCMDEE